MPSRQSGLCAIMQCNMVLIYTRSALWDFLLAVIWLQRLAHILILCGRSWLIRMFVLTLCYLFILLSVLMTVSVISARGIICLGKILIKALSIYFPMKIK